MTTEQRAGHPPMTDAAIEAGRLMLVGQAIGNTQLLVDGTLFDLLCTTTYANDHSITRLLHDAARSALSALDEAGAQSPVTIAQWDAMTREERADLMRSHKPSDEAMRWADSVAPSILRERAKSDPASFGSLGKLLDEAGGAGEKTLNYQTSSPCPQCGARSGEPCRLPGGRPANIPHHQRPQTADVERELSRLRAANAALTAEVKKHAALIEKFGDAITDMFEQMLRGKWTDDHGHDVRMNKQMEALKPLVGEAIALRAALASATGEGG